jgi:hypothetical protein
MSAMPLHNKFIEKHAFIGRQAAERRHLAQSVYHVEKANMSRRLI